MLKKLKNPISMTINKITPTTISSGHPAAAPAAAPAAPDMGGMY